MPSRSTPFSRRFDYAGYAVGFGLSGFFDGILLHQILQWHHLLSAVAANGLADLRGQVVADGAFHALMYVIVAAGLLLLARARGDFVIAGANHRLLANLAIGFGAWHAVDAVLSHWVLGIHRIRMDVDNPLAWDLGWLAVFGIVPLAIGVLMRRREPPGEQAGGRRSASALPMILAAVAVTAGYFAAQPSGDPGQATVVVVLRHDVRPAAFLSALDGTGARIVWNDAGGGVWVLRPDADFDRFALYRRGALFVSGTLVPAGCAAWVNGA